MYQQTVRNELSFEGQPLTRGRHRIHPYPAMLHPLLVDFLLEEYATEGDVVFDPFCGSGVTLLQSSVRSHKSFGFDINPIALLIARSKTKRYALKKLRAEFGALGGKLKRIQKTDVPNIKNIDYWYAEDVARDLGKIRYALKTMKEDLEYIDFFTTVFAFVCRHQSLTKNGEFKRYRIKADKINAADNEVFEKFVRHTEDMIEEFSNSDIPRKTSKPILANSEIKIGEDIRYNLVITSPPYGDSMTTVAYGQYSSFGEEWIGDLNTFGRAEYNVDREGLGKAGQLNEEIYQCKPLVETLGKIEKKDRKRAREVLHFFNGYYNAIKNTVANLERKGRMCFVVGNRTVKGYQIPMDQITASFFDSLGLSFENIFVRDIHSKVMPLKNSPSNKAGVKGKTMANEYIVIFRKDKLCV